MLFFDPYFLIIVGPAMLLAFWAQQKVKNAFDKYKQIRNSSRMTGREAARKMLDQRGLHDVDIERTEGTLSDHYDPGENVLRLSPEVHDEASIASVGIACHEAGHAIQDAEEYTPLVVRNAVVPMASFGSWISFPLIFLGLLLHMAQLMVIGIVIFAAIVVFQLVNLPVEFNASTRAKEDLKSLGILQREEERKGVDQVLDAAALTYVAATIVALSQLLYFVMLFIARR